MSRLGITLQTMRRLGGLFNGRVSPTGERPSGVSTGTQEPKARPRGGSRLGFPNSLPGSRIAELALYDELYTEISDVPGALDAYATMATTGDVAGGGFTGFRVIFEDEAAVPEELIERSERMQMLFHTHSFHNVRGMAHYGSLPVDLALSQSVETKKWEIADLVAVPPGQMFRNPAGGDEAYWSQKIDGNERKKIPRWRILHLANWKRHVNAMHVLLYGESVFQRFARTGLQMGGILDSMLVARLSRACARYVHKVDVTDIMGDDSAIEERLARFAEFMSRGTDIIGNGQYDSVRRPRVPDEDLYVPSSKNFDFGTDILEGDMNLANIDDVVFFAAFYFGALGVPAEYLGHERKNSGRSSLSQIDIQFARSSRHLQRFLCAGYEHALMVDMMLGGFEPRDYPARVVAPKIGARDDLLQAQIRALQATTIQALRTAGMDFRVSPKWILQTFMRLDDAMADLTDEQIERLFLAVDQMTPGGGRDDPPSGRSMETVRSVLSNVGGSGYLAEIRRIVTLPEVIDDEVFDYREGQPTVENLIASKDLRTLL